MKISTLLVFNFKLTVSSLLLAMLASLVYGHHRAHRFASSSVHPEGIDSFPIVLAVSYGCCCFSNVMNKDSKDHWNIKEKCRC